MCACFALPANRREWGESGASEHSGLVEAPRDRKQTPPPTLGARRWRPTDRPIHLLRLATCGCAEVLDEWGGDLPRPLRSDSRPEPVRLHCSRTEPNIRPRCLSAVETPSLRSRRSFFATSIAPLDKNSLPAGHNKKKVGGKSFSQDVTSR